MKCGVHEADLSALLDGEPDALAERRLRDHLGVCPSCRAAFARLRAVSAALRASAAEVPPSPAFVDRVVRGALTAPRRPARRTAPAVPFALSRPVLAAAAVLLLLGLSAAALIVAARGGGAPPGDVSRPAPGRAEAPFDVAGFLASLRGEGAGRPSLAPAGGRSLGDPLPPVRPRVAPPAPPTREERFAALGLTADGGRWSTPEAWRRARDHREAGELLARAAERRTARERTAAGAAVPPPAANPVAQYLATVRAGALRSSDGVAVLPLTDGDRPPSLAVASVEDALADGTLDVREDPGSGAVVAENAHADRHVFVAAGQLLVGGHQDRIVTRPTLIPPRTRVRLWTLCCEPGRSTGASPVFSRSPGIAPPGVRALLLGAGAQAAVWQRIGVELERVGAGSETGALRALFGSHRTSARAAGLAAAFQPLFAEPRAVGFAVYAGGRLRGAEVFASHEAFAAFGPRYLESYLFRQQDGEGMEGAPEGAVAALRLVAGTGRYYESAGAAAGLEFEFGGAGLSGSALLAREGDRPFHVSLLPGDPDPPRSRDSGTGYSDPPPPPGSEAPREDGAERRRKERQEDPRRPGELPVPPGGPRNGGLTPGGPGPVPGSGGSPSGGHGPVPPRDLDPPR